MDPRQSDETYLHDILKYYFGEIDSTDEVFRTIFNVNAMKNYYCINKSLYDMNELVPLDHNLENKSFVFPFM